MILLEESTGSSSFYSIDVFSVLTVNRAAIAFEKICEGIVRQEVIHASGN